MNDQLINQNILAMFQAAIDKVMEAKKTVKQVREEKDRVKREWAVASMRSHQMAHHPCCGHYEQDWKEEVEKKLDEYHEKANALEIVEKEANIALQELERLLEEQIA